jgi:hypothetical protein
VHKLKLCDVGDLAIETKSAVTSISLTTRSHADPPALLPLMKGRFKASATIANFGLELLLISVICHDHKDTLPPNVNAYVHLIHHTCKIVE